MIFGFGSKVNVSEVAAGSDSEMTTSPERPVCFPRFAMVAYPRSGTNFLRSMINQNKGMFCFGEVLFPDEHFFGFFNYLRIKQERNPALHLPHMWSSILGDFLNDQYLMMEEAGNDHVGFDFKLPQLETFYNAYSLIRDRGYGVVHVKRINVPAAIFSLDRTALAISQNLPTHAQFQHPKTTLKVDEDWLRRRIFLQEHGHALADHWLRGPGYVEVFYEDLLSPKGLRLTAAKLSLLFGRQVTLSGTSRLFRQANEDPKSGIEGSQAVYEIIDEYAARVDARAAEIEAMSE